MPKIIYRYVLLEGTIEHPTELRIDAWVACGNGKKFEGIATVKAPLGVNPALKFPRPYGMNGIHDILTNIQEGINPSDIIDMKGVSSDFEAQ